MAVREALARCHGGRVTPEQPPKGEHQANGLAEVTGRNVRDHVRVLKLHQQKRLGRKVLEDEPVAEAEARPLRAVLLDAREEHLAHPGR